MKYTLFILSSLMMAGWHNGAYAQTNVQALSPNPILASEASFLNPSYLKNTRKFQLNIAPLMGINAHIGSNFVSAGNIMDYIRLYNDDNQQTNFAPIHEMMDNLRPNNTIMAAVDFTLLHATYRIGKPDNAIHLGLSVRQHMNTSVTFNDEFFRLVYGGNKQFAGQTVQFNPNVSGISYTDFGLAISKTFNLGELQVTPGARLRFLLGNAAAYTKRSNLGFYTQADGEYIELTGQLEAYAGGIDVEDGEWETGSIMEGIGKGFAIDLGVTATYKNLSFSVASIDNGSIRFNKDNSWYLGSYESIRWEGYDMVAGYEGVEFSENLVDQLTLSDEKRAFNTGIGNKLTFNANYGIGAKSDKNDYSYYTHNIGLNAIQGLVNRFNASTTTLYSIYYQYNLRNRLTAGVNYNGYGNISDLGFNVGFRYGGINLGLGSNSLIALANTDASRQFNFFFLLGVAIQ